jgi:predicted nucleic acid-binding protein
MNVVDSSGWLEYFADGPNVGFLSKAIEATADLIVPTMSLYEVFKRVLQQRGEGEALRAMADSVILATARACEATLWSQDSDFAKIPAVRYIAARGGGKPG